MAFNGSGAASGAATGASTGASFGPYGAAIGGVVGGIAGGLMKKKRRQPNLQPLLDTINASGQRSQDLIKSVRPQTTVIGQKFGQDVNALANQHVGNAKTLGEDFVKRAGDASGELAKQQFETGKQNLLSTVPEQTQNLREQLASSGLNRGGAFLKQTDALNRQVGTGLNDLNNQTSAANLESKQRAISSAFANNAQAAETATGLNSDSLNKLFASGRADLINEVNDLLAEESSRTGRILGVQGQQADNTFASQLAGDRNKQALIDQAVGGIGGLIGKLSQNKQNNKTNDLLAQLLASYGGN